MVKLFRALLVAAVGLVSLNASATNYNFGAVSDGFNALGTHSVAVGAFSDTISFTLGGSSSLSGAASSFQFNVGALPVLSITGLTAELYNSSNVLLGSGLSFSAPGFQAAGSYYLKLSGTANGVIGGLYSAGLNVSPAPEPETWAMMIAGLGLVGSIARRKKSNVLAVA